MYKSMPDTARSSPQPTEHISQPTPYHIPQHAWLEVVPPHGEPSEVGFHSQPLWRRTTRLVVRAFTLSSTSQIKASSHLFLLFSAWDTDSVDSDGHFGGGEECAEKGDKEDEEESDDDSFVGNTYALSLIHI